MADVAVLKCCVVCGVVVAGRGLCELMVRNVTSDRYVTREDGVVVPAGEGVARPCGE